MIKKKQSSEMVAVFLIPFYSVIFFLKSIIFKVERNVLITKKDGSEAEVQVIR